MENDAENNKIPSRLLIPRILIFVNKERATRALCFIIHVIVVIIGCDEENKNKKRKKIKSSPEENIMNYTISEKYNEVNHRWTLTYAEFSELINSLKTGS